jgi:hypothetical protein
MLKSEFIVQVSSDLIIVTDLVTGECWETSHEYLADIMQVLTDRVQYAVEDFAEKQE